MSFLQAFAGFLVVLLPQWIGRPEPAHESKLQVWIATPHKRVYPNSFGRDLDRRVIELQVCRNEHAVFQLGVRSPRPVGSVVVHAGDLAGPGGARLAASLFRIRYPGLIPVDESGQHTPDPLWEVPAVSLRPQQSQGIWIDLKTPRDAPAGKYEGTLDVTADGTAAGTFRIALEVLPATLPDPADFHFYLDIWADPSSIARLNKLPLWGDAHWRLVERYVRNLADHGQKTINAFIVDDPWNSLTGFAVRGIVEWKFPGEWKPEESSRLSFDFTSFDRWVELCMHAGIRNHIEAWSPLVHPNRDFSVVTYTDTLAGRGRKVKLTAGSPEYRAMWGAFARTFERHLRAKGWLAKTHLAFDEIKSAVLDRVVPFFHEVAPGLKVALAGGDERGHYASEAPQLAFFYGHYTPGSGWELPDIPARRKAGKRTLLYTMVAPLYPNTFLFSDPHESRYLGWIIWKWDFDGYLRWAWNFWPESLWDQPRYIWHSGDMFFVYPGPVGPVDSIRWEMLRKGIEDYECLWLARERIAQIRASGRRADLAKKCEEDLARAVELATRQFDRPQSPRIPVETRLDEGRRILNEIIRATQSP